MFTPQHILTRVIIVLTMLVVFSGAEDSGHAAPRSAAGADSVSNPPVHNLADGNASWAGQPTPQDAPDPYANSVVAYEVYGASNTHTNPATVVGPPCKGDGQDLSLGGGWVIVDMGEGEEICDGPGDDLFVFESADQPLCNGGGASPFEAYVSNSATGPWTSLGQGNASTSFDLSSSGLSSARYVRVQDRSPGQPDPGSPTPGADMAGFRALNMSLCATSVEINQALGQQFNGAQKYVAGKDTVIRVYLSKSITTSSSSQRVEVRRNGSLVTTLYPQPSPYPTDVLTFWCPNRAVCGNWQEGDYVFRATVGASASEKAATFAPRRTLRILAVPVRVNDQGTIRTPDDSWKSGDVFLRHVFPVATDGVDWMLGSELDATSYDLTQPGICFPIGPWGPGRCRLWKDLKDRQPYLCGWPDRPACYDMIVGFIPAMRARCMTQCEECGCSVGWTYGKPATIVMTNGSFDTPCPNRPTIEINSMRSNVAHEFGHTFDDPLGDEYNYPFGRYRCDNNPPPPDYRGTDWNGIPTCNSAYRCTGSDEQPWPYGTGSGSLVGSGSARPVEINPTVPGSPARGTLPDMLSFMGSGSYQRDMWVTPRTYNHLYDQLAPTLMSKWTPASSVDAVLVSGWVGQDGSVGLDPWHRFSVPLVDPVTGAYSVEAVNGAGQVLASQGFDVSFIAMSNPPDIIDPAPFEAVLNFPAGTVAFRIKHGIDLLAEVPVSLHTPTVQVTAPTAGQVLSGIGTIAWQSQDEDGDELYHTLEYSADGQEWQVLSSVITQTQFTVDFSTLPGGATAQVRVIASDGVNTATATSEAFTVVRTPPEVSIYAPASGSLVPWALTVTLSGGAYDYRDGWLRDPAVLSWSSDRDGVLGGGENLHVNTLSPGLHTITLAATNSVNLVSSATMTLTVGMPGDLNGDGCIFVDDVAAVAAVWLQEADAPLDLNGDGVITVVDIMVVAAQWDGLCVPD